MLSLSMSMTSVALIAYRGASILRREADGTITVVSLARTWAPTLTRQPDGSVNIQG